MTTRTHIGLGMLTATLLGGAVAGSNAAAPAVEPRIEKHSARHAGGAGTDHGALIAATAAAVLIAGTLWTWAPFPRGAARQ